MSEKFVLEIAPQNCGHVFKNWGELTEDVAILRETPMQVGLIVFTGGVDVHPELYGENMHRTTFSSFERDVFEGKIFEQAQKYKIPCVGICRGAQFLCVKAGGKLVQDIHGHGWGHKMRTSEDREMECNSSHHQMQLPPDDAIPLAWADPPLSAGHYRNGDDNNVDVDREYEVVYYPNINSLGIQYHPEWLHPEHPCVRYAKRMARKYLGKEQ